MSIFECVALTVAPAALLAYLWVGVDWPVAKKKHVDGECACGNPAGHSGPCQPEY